MWIVWGSLVMGCFLFATYLTQKDDVTNSFSRDLGVFELGILMIPFGICMVYRFLLIPKIKNVIAIFPVYVIGLFMSELIIFFGIFLIREYLNLFYILCGTAMFIYMPCWIKINQSNKAQQGNAQAAP